MLILLKNSKGRGSERQRERRKKERKKEKRKKKRGGGGWGSGTLLQAVGRIGVQFLWVYKTGLNSSKTVIVQELCESRGGRPGLSVLTSLWFQWT